MVPVFPHSGSVSLGLIALLILFLLGLRLTHPRGWALPRRIKRLQRAPHMTPGALALVILLLLAPANPTVFPPFLLAFSTVGVLEIVRRLPWRRVSDLDSPDYQARRNLLRAVVATGLLVVISISLAPSLERSGQPQSARAAGSDSSVIAVSAPVGGRNSMVLRADGTVWAWGENLWGQLGDGTTTDRSVPQPVPQLTDIVAVSAGAQDEVALKNDGTVWIWGANQSGQAGMGSVSSSGCDCLTTPTQVPGLSGVTSIAAGSTFILALKSDGTVWAWGDNRQGQLA